MIFIVIISWLLIVVLSMVLIFVCRRVQMQESCLIDFKNELRCLERDFRIGCNSIEEFSILTTSRQIEFDAKMDFLESQVKDLRVAAAEPKIDN